MSTKSWPDNYHYDEKAILDPRNAHINPAQHRHNASHAISLDELCFRSWHPGTSPDVPAQGLLGSATYENSDVNLRLMSHQGPTTAEAGALQDLHRMAGSSLSMPYRPKPMFGFGPSEASTTTSIVNAGFPAPALASNIPNYKVEDSHTNDGGSRKRARLPSCDRQKRKKRPSLKQVRLIPPVRVRFNLSEENDRIECLISLFQSIGTKPLKRMLSGFIDKLCLKKTNRFPYPNQDRKGSGTCVPGWWPLVVPWSSPSHSLNHDVFAMALHIFRMYWTVEDYIYYNGEPLHEREGQFCWSTCIDEFIVIKEEDFKPCTRLQQVTDATSCAETLKWLLHAENRWVNCAIGESAVIEYEQHFQKIPPREDWRTLAKPWMRQPSRCFNNTPPRSRQLSIPRDGEQGKPSQISVPASENQGSHVPEPMIATQSAPDLGDSNTTSTHRSISEILAPCATSVAGIAPAQTNGSEFGPGHRGQATMSMYPSSQLPGLRQILNDQTPMPDPAQLPNLLLNNVPVHVVNAETIVHDSQPFSACPDLGRDFLLDMMFVPNVDWNFWSSAVPAQSPEPNYRPGLADMSLTDDQGTYDLDWLYDM